MKATSRPGSIERPSKPSYTAHVNISRDRSRSKTEKIEEEFLKGLTELEKFMTETLGEMRKEEKGAKN